MRADILIACSGRYEAEREVLRKLDEAQERLALYRRERDAHHLWRAGYEIEKARELFQALRDL